MTTRLSEAKYMLSVAQTAASRSTCSRLSVGAVVAAEGRVIGTGYNGAPVGVEHCVHVDDEPCRISVHAEVNALLYSPLTSVDSAWLYVTHAPCFDCSKLILNTPVVGVVYGELYRSTEGLELLERHGVWTGEPR